MIFQPLFYEGQKRVLSLCVISDAKLLFVLYNNYTDDYEVLVFLKKLFFFATKRMEVASTEFWINLFKKMVNAMIVLRKRHPFQSVHLTCDGVEASCSICLIQ